MRLVTPACTKLALDGLSKASNTQDVIKVMSSVKQEMSCFEACLFISYYKQVKELDINLNLVIDVVYGKENIYDIAKLYKKYKRKYIQDLYGIKDELPQLVIDKTIEEAYTTEYDTSYIKERDMTCIFKRRYLKTKAGLELISEEITGCYFGEPDEVFVEMFKHSGVYIEYV